MLLLYFVLLICSEILEENSLHDNHKKLSLVNHPALLGHIWEFLKQVKFILYGTCKLIILLCCNNIIQQTSASDSWSRSKSISNRSELRAEYLDYLEQKQLRGMVTFIRTFLQPA